MNVDEFITFNLVLIKGSLFTQVGVDAKFDPEAEGEFHSLPAPRLDQHMSKVRFKFLLHNMMWMFATHMEWDNNTMHRTWAMLQPRLTSWSVARRLLLKFSKVIWDENMWEHVPKNSKLGGAPHVNWEPRKPKPIGIMTRTAMSVKFKAILCHAICDPSWRNEYESDARLTGSGSMNKATAEMCRCMDDMQYGDRDATGRLLYSGSMHYGDAYFGNIDATIQFHKRYGVDVCLLVKAPNSYISMDAMIERLTCAICANNKARGVAADAVPAHEHTVHTEQHVFASSTVDGVQLLMLAFKFSHRRPPNLFVCTAGKTMPTCQYFSKFEEDDIVQERGMPRAAVMNEFFSTASDIDNHNNLRQDKLDLVGAWISTKFWNKMNMQLNGEAWVDFYQITKAASNLLYANESLQHFSSRVTAYMLTNRRNQRKRAGPSLVQYEKRDTKKCKNLLQQHPCIECAIRIRNEHEAQCPMNKNTGKPMIVSQWRRIPSVG